MIAVAAALLLGVSSTAPHLGCLRVIKPVAVGDPIATSDLGEAVACAADDGVPAVGFDRATSMVRARRDLAIGDIIVAQPLGALPAVRKGDNLIMRSRIGAIAVERPVTALQAGRAGRQIFVTTTDGQVVPVRVDEDLP